MQKRMGPLQVMKAELMDLCDIKKEKRACNSLKG